MCFSNKHPCAWGGCNLYFANIPELILHIEAIHLPKWEKENPSFPRMNILDDPDNADAVAMTVKNVMWSTPITAGFLYARENERANRNVHYPFMHSYCLERRADVYNDLMICSSPMVPPSAVLRYYRNDLPLGPPPVGSLTDPKADNCFEASPSDLEPSCEAAIANASVKEEPVHRMEADVKGKKLEIKKELDTKVVKQQKMEVHVKGKKLKIKKELDTNVVKQQKLEHVREKKLKIKKELDTKVVRQQKIKEPPSDDLNDPGNDYYHERWILFYCYGTKQKTEETLNLVRPYLCPVPSCSKEYKNQNGIRYHAKRAHKGPPRLECSHCGFESRSMQGLSSHIKAGKHKDKEGKRVKIKEENDANDTSSDTLGPMDVASPRRNRKRKNSVNSVLAAPEPIKIETVTRDTQMEIRSGNEDADFICWTLAPDPPVTRSKKRKLMDK